MRRIKIDDVTNKAVRAAMAIIDDATDDTTKRSAGPCGDKLAFALDEMISKALAAHFRDEDAAPAFVTATDLAEFTEFT